MLPVADPGFPRGGGANHQGGGANLLFGRNFPKSCMKMKEFGPRGGGHTSLVPPPLDPPMVTLRFSIDSPLGRTTSFVAVYELSFSLFVSDSLNKTN